MHYKPVCICVLSFGIIFVSLNAGKIHYTICSAAEETIIIKLGITVRTWEATTTIYLMRAWKKRHKKNSARRDCAVMNVLARPEIDCEPWGCETMLWNPPWPVSTNLMTHAFSRRTSFIFCAEIWGCLYLWSIWIIYWHLGNCHTRSQLLYRHELRNVTLQEKFTSHHTTSESRIEQITPHMTSIFKYENNKLEETSLSVSTWLWLQHYLLTLALIPSRWIWDCAPLMSSDMQPHWPMVGEDCSLFRGTMGR